MKLSACINLGWTCAFCHKFPRAQTVPRCAHNLCAVPAAEPTWHHSPAGALCAASRSNSNLPGGRDKALAALKEQPYLPAPQGYLCPPAPRRRDAAACLYPQLQRNGCRWCSWPQPPWKAMAGERPLAPRVMPRLPRSLPFVITAEPPKYPCQKHVRFQPQPGSDKECSIWSTLEAACSCFSPCRRSLGSRAVVLQAVPSGEN